MQELSSPWNTHTTLSDRPTTASFLLLYELQKIFYIYMSRILQVSDARAKGAFTTINVFTRDLTSSTHPQPSLLYPHKPKKNPIPEPAFMARNQFTQTAIMTVSEVAPKQYSTRGFLRNKISLQTSLETGQESVTCTDWGDIFGERDFVGSQQITSHRKPPNGINSIYKKGNCSHLWFTKIFHR